MDWDLGRIIAMNLKQLRMERSLTLGQLAKESGVSKAILSDMEKGMGEAKGRYVTIPDRAAAVKYAVDMAEEGDILLFAGKGHEDYQLIRGQRVPFCERELIRHYAALRLGQPEAEDTVAG